MRIREQLYRSRWLLLTAILLLMAVVLIISPEEKTLAAGIKPVYLHVSLTWTGMTMFLITGLAGLVVLAANSPAVAGFQRKVFLVGLFFFSAGFIVSMYASWLNWGGIPLQEPKFQMVINVLVAGIGAWYLRELVPNLRLKGLVGAIPVVFLFLGGRSPRMALHPDNPVMSSPLTIMISFFGMFTLALLLVAGLIWFSYSREVREI